MAEEYIRRLIVSGPEVSETVDLGTEVITIGRQAGVEVRLDHPLVSRRHAQVKCTAKGCQVMDLGSANGTNLNGVPLEAKAPTPLPPGGVIEIGPFKMVFEQIAVEPIAPPPPPPPKPKKAPEPKPEPKPEEKPEPVKAVKPPSPPVLPPPPPPKDGAAPDYSQPPPGLSMTQSRYLEYLPGIYQTDFMSRFLAIFEAVLAPIEWTVDNFDLYLDPDTSPEEFTPWLANWFSITFDPTWSLEKQRTLLHESHKLFARRGTRWALARVLEIYTGTEPEIIDQDDKAEPFTFTVKIPFTEDEVDRRLIEIIVDSSKPAHTNYSLLFKETSRKRGR